MLDAVEVLLAVFGGVLPETAANASPFLLCAYSSAEDLQLQILHVPEGQEQSRCVLADALPEPAVPTMLVLLLRHAAQREQIRTVRPCVLAFRNGSGTLVFEQNESCMKMEDNYDDKQQKL